MSRPPRFNSYADNWERTFRGVPEASSEAQTPVAPSRGGDHEFKFKGNSPHNNEDWYECTKCGFSDWCATYHTIDNTFDAGKCPGKKP